MDNGFSETSTAYAVISPCSQCKNQLSEMSAEGKPFCPRRKWQAEQEAYVQQNGRPDPRLVLLAAYGTEGTSQEGGKSLRNPVYLDGGKTTLVWIAALRDNVGVRDGDNAVIAPSILDPSFIPDHTDRIHCRLHPFIPSLHEAAYRQSGNLKEGDLVTAMTVSEQQFDVNVEPVEGQPNEYQSLLIDGVVNKVNLALFTPRTPVEVDFTTEGT